VLWENNSDRAKPGTEGQRRTTPRFDGYNYFGQHPEKMLAWFGKYMG